MHNTPHTEEAKRKMSEALKGKANKFKGKKHSEDSRKNMSIGHIGKSLSEEHRKNISIALKKNPPMLGKCMSEESKKKMSLAKLGKSPWNKGAKGLTTAWNKGLNISGMSGKKRSIETRKKSSVSLKNVWDSLSPDERNNRIFCWAKSQQFSPNKIELKLLKLLEKMYPNEWKFTGDFSFIIDGKSPDFTNINGQKKLIELFGDYWHKGQNPQDRIDVFKPFGYDTLVIWETELKNMERVKFRINKFYRKGVSL